MRAMDTIKWSLNMQEGYQANQSLECPLASDCQPESDKWQACCVYANLKVHYVRFRGNY